MPDTLSNAATERIGGPESRPGVNAEWLDVGAVAALLGCSATHVYCLSNAGRMPRPLKLETLVRWSRAGVLAWIEAGCRTPSIYRLRSVPPNRKHRCHTPR